MKQGKKPTREQSKLIAKCPCGKGSLNPANWLVSKNLSDKLIIVNRKSGKKMTVYTEV